MRAKNPPRALETAISCRLFPLQPNENDTCGENVRNKKNRVPAFSKFRHLKMIIINCFEFPSYLLLLLRCFASFPFQPLALIDCKTMIMMMHRWERGGGGFVSAAIEPRVALQRQSSTVSHQRGKNFDVNKVRRKSNCVWEAARYATVVN